MADVCNEVLRKRPCESGLVANVSVFLWLPFSPSSLLGVMDDAIDLFHISWRLRKQRMSEKSRKLIPRAQVCKLECKLHCSDD